MKKSIKRYIIVVFMVLAIVTNEFVFAETFNMSDEELDKAIETFMENLKKEAQESDSSSVDTDMKMERENDTIKIIMGGETVEFKYDFSNDCKFYVDTKYTKTMTYDEAEEVSGMSSVPMYGFLIISSSKGNSTLDTMMYIFTTILEEISWATIEKNINGLEYEKNINGLEYAKEILKQNQVLDKALYRTEITKVSESSDEIVLRTSFIVKTDADFSVVEGAFDKFVEDLENSLGGNTGTTDSNNSTNNSKDENEKELPQAGIDITLVNTLKISVVVVGAAVVLLLVKCFTRRENKNEK